MFHVPESARVTNHPQLASDPSDGNNGAFFLDSPEPGWRLALICSDGSALPGLVPWEHVSAHAFTEGRKTKLRTPTWKEMNYVKGLCWDDEDVVVQFHPRRSEYVNNHPHVLHLWRPIDVELPTPPSIAVGLTDSEMGHSVDRNVTG